MRARRHSAYGQTSRPHLPRPGHAPIPIAVSSSGTRHMRVARLLGLVIVIGYTCFGALLPPEVRVHGGYSDWFSS